MLVLLFTLITALCANAAEIRGRVLDPQHSAVPHAWISALSRNGSDIRKVRTDASGGFVFTSVTPGDYLLDVEAAGFSQRQSLPVRLTSNQTETLEIVLELAVVPQRIAVISSSTPLSIDETAKAMDVISAADLRDREEFSIGEALRQIPGMRVQQLGGPGAFTRLHTRGLRAFDTSILIDGFRLRDAGSPQGDASAYLNDLLVVDLSRVEVLRGSGSSLYGTHALGAVVNLVTDQGGGPLHGEVSAQGGGLGMFNGTARLGGSTLGNRLDYTAGVAHLNVFRGVDGDDRARNSSLQGSALYRLSPRSRLSARLWVADTFAGLNASPFAGPAGNIPASGFVTAVPLAPDQAVLAAAGQPFSWGNANYAPSLNDPDARREARTVTALLAFTQELAPGTAIRLNYQGLTTARDNRDGPGGVRFPPRFNNSAMFNGRIDDVQARVDSSLGRHHLVSFGYEFEREWFENVSRDENPIPAQRVFARTAVPQRSHSVFAQEQIRLLDSRLLVSLSGRYQGFTLQRPAFEGGAPRYTTQDLPSPPRALTGDIAIAYLLRGTGTKLRSHIGNAYRSAALYERFGTSFFGGSFSPFGDPRLRPERSIAVDAGFDQYFANSKVRIGVTYFYTRLQNVIAFGGLLGRDPFDRFSGYLNTRGGLARGLETSGEAQLWRGMRLIASYTHTRAQEKFSIYTDGLLLSPRVAKDLGTILFTQRFGKRFDITTDFSLAGESAFPLFAGSGSRAFIYAGGKKADVAASYSIPVSDRTSLQVFLRVDNFLNRTWYEDGFRVPKAWAVGGLRLLF